MKTIMSSQNPIIKQCTQLKKKFRDQYDAFLVEGDKLVLEAINLERVKYLLVREDRVADFQEHAKKWKKPFAYLLLFLKKLPTPLPAKVLWR